MSDWQPIDSAPKDGTEIEINFRHENWHYCNTAEDRAGWEEICRARWIDHNGGGWTWEGICGVPVAWRPLSPPHGLEREKK